MQTVLKSGSSTVSVPLSINTTDDYLAGSSSQPNTAANRKFPPQALFRSPFQLFQHRRPKTP